MMSAQTKSSWWLRLSMLLLVLLMLSLGLWQLDRSEQKRARLDLFAQINQPLNLNQVDSSQLSRYSGATVRGSYLTNQQVIMDGISANKQAGYMVLTPFRLEGSDKTLMVNRGWRPWQSLRDEITGIEVDTQTRSLSGRLDHFWEPGLVLGEGNQAEAESWPRLSVYPQVDEINAWLNRDVMPWQLLLSSEANDGFRREWKPAGISPERHFGYALQWFAMAIALVILLFVSSRNSRDK